MKSSEIALVGFRRIYLEQVGAIAIVDSNDVLIGTLSASDIRGISESDLNQLLFPVSEYLVKRGVYQPSVYLSSTATLEQTLKALLDSKVHRIWMCDKDRKLNTVITMSDIIRLYSQ